MQKSIIFSMQSKLQDLFTQLKRILEIDCSDVDLPKGRELYPDDNRVRLNNCEKDCANRERVLANPYLGEFFSFMSQKHKSKKMWFNQK